jgi:DNA-binding NtrC family response regulator
VLQDVASLEAPAQATLLRLLSPYPSLILPRHRSRRATSLRLISLSQVDVASLVRQGRFRQDLFYRLAVVRLQLPSLRDRRADLPLLADPVLQRIATAYGYPTPTLDAQAWLLLRGYAWPGNLGEFAQVLEQAVLRARGRSSLTAGDFDGLLDRVCAPAPIELPVGITLAEAEREVILRTLAARGGNRTLAAETLQISRRTLYERIARYARSGDRSGSGAPS